jgi:hypothetical protein
MDFLSESAKKERRSLLATGFAGIIVARLKIYPTEIDLIGLRFKSDDLPFIAVGALCATICYFAIKFSASFLYERSSSLTKLLAAQISEGKSAIDLAREEQALSEQGRNLVHQSEVIENEKKRGQRQIKEMIEKLTAGQGLRDAELQATDEEISKNEEILSGALVSAPGDPFGDYDKLRTTISLLKGKRERYMKENDPRQREDFMNIENERYKQDESHRAQLKELAIEERSFIQKGRQIEEWKNALGLARHVSPIHLFLEIYLPLGIGVIAIGSLVFLMFHFPSPPTLSVPGGF